MADHVGTSSINNEENSQESSTNMSGRVRKQCYMHVTSVTDEREQDFTFTRWNTFKFSITMWLGLDGDSRALAEVYEYCRDIKFGDIPEDAAFHPTCYRRFIDKRRMERAARRIGYGQTVADGALKPEDEPVGISSLKYNKRFRWRSGLTVRCGDSESHYPCLICNKPRRYIKVRGKRTSAPLVRAVTSAAGQLWRAAKLKQDKRILLHIKDKDCVSLEVRYHRCCYKQYISFLKRYSTTSVKPENEPTFDVSYNIFCKKIIRQRIIVNQEVMRMNHLRSIFSDLVKTHEGLDASNYSQDALKKRMIYDFPQLVFHTPTKRNVCELVLVETLSLEEQTDMLPVLSGTEATLSSEVS